MRKFFSRTLILCLLLSAFSLHAQPRGGTAEFNMFGFKLGGSLFDIKTDNFVTSSEMGFIGGMATRGNFYNNWDIQFGINLSSNNLKITGRESAISNTELIEYSLLNAQVQLIFGYKLIGNHRNARSDFKVTLEAGPILMVNGKMKYSNDKYQNYLIEGTSLTAEQIQGITGVNANALGGISLGMERFRVFAHYQYGLNNILNKLNKVEGHDEDFNGRVNMIQFGVLFYF